MNNKRREFLKAGMSASALALVSRKPAYASERSDEITGRIQKAMASPVLNTNMIKQPVKIAAVDLLKNGNQYLIRARSTDGAAGISIANPAVINSTYPILLNRVLPFFTGKDARELESLIDGVYLQSSNYKWQGLAFWACVAAVDFAILDLLGKVAGKPVGALFGEVTRRDIAVYRASEKRGNSPEEEIDYLRQMVAETGAKAIKFRLGARMKYDDKSTRRDTALIPLTRKTFGDGMTIYADANGSYDVPMSIKIGRLMEEHKLSFFEEPCPFDYYDETKQIADALAIPVAGGEQESSMRRFRWMIENKGVRIVQPDLFYFGGLTRSMRVARMAAAAGMDCTPHMSGGGIGYLYVLHFASCVPNAGPFQEYKGEEDDFLPVSSDTSSLKSKNGMIRVPTGPGLGIVVEPDFVSRATQISK